VRRGQLRLLLCHGGDQSPDLALEHFAGDRFGQRVHNHVLPWAFVNGHAVATPLPQIFKIKGDTGVQRDCGAHAFDPGGIGNTNYRRLINRRVAHEYVFDLSRPDLVARGVDHVLLAVDQIEPLSRPQLTALFASLIASPPTPMSRSA